MYNTRQIKENRVGSNSSSIRTGRTSYQFNGTQEKLKKNKKYKSNWQTNLPTVFKQA